MTVRLRLAKEISKHLPQRRSRTWNSCTSVRSQEHIWQDGIELSGSEGKFINFQELSCTKLILFISVVDKDYEIRTRKKTSLACSRLSSSPASSSFTPGLPCKFIMCHCLKDVFTVAILTKLTWDFLLGKVILTMSMTSVNVRATCKRKCLFCKSKVCGFCLVVLLFKVCYMVHLLNVCYMVHLLNVCYMVHLLKHVSRVLTLRPPPVIRRWVISQLLFHFS